MFGLGGLRTSYLEKMEKGAKWNKICHELQFLFHRSETDLFSVLA